MEEIKQLVDELNQAFMEHKAKNDQRLNEIQKKIKAASSSLSDCSARLSQLKQRWTRSPTGSGKPDLISRCLAFNSLKLRLMVSPLSGQGLHFFDRSIELLR